MKRAVDNFDQFAYDVEPSAKRRAPVDVAVDPASASAIIPAVPAGGVADADQQRVLAAVAAGRNVFITGAGGCGKSWVIQELRRQTEAGEGVMVLAASTNAAVAVINGDCTIHAFCGWTPSAKTPSATASRIGKQRNVATRIRQCTRLVIDEISMISAGALAWFSEVVARVRNRTGPFGGLQLIVSGDFYQLPPVPDRGATEAENRPCLYGPCWQACQFVTCTLTTPHRFADAEYVALLQRVRVGTPSAEDYAALQSRVGANVTKDGITPTMLSATRAQVDSLNQTELEKCPAATEHVYPATILVDAPKGATSPKPSAVDLAKRVTARRSTVLRVGAQVMCVKNLPELALYNGARGVVVAFVDAQPEVRWAAGHTCVVGLATWTMADPQKQWSATYTQIPLLLAWATTIHVTQGATLDCVECDLGPSIFQGGQGYVALSRVKSLACLSLRHFVPQALRAPVLPTPPPSASSSSAS